MASSLPAHANRYDASRCCDACGGCCRLLPRVVIVVLAESNAFNVGSNTRSLLLLFDLDVEPRLTRDAILATRLGTLQLVVESMTLISSSNASICCVVVVDDDNDIFPSRTW